MHGVGAPRRWSSPHKEVDAHARLDAKDVVYRSGKLRIVANIAAKIQHIDGCEFLVEAFSHPIEDSFADEPVVCDQCDQPFWTDSVGRPPNRFDVGVSEFRCAGGGRVSTVRGRKPLVDGFIFPVGIRFVLIGLAHVVRRIPEDHENLLRFLLFHALGVFLRHEREQR